MWHKTDALNRKEKECDGMQRKTNRRDEKTREDKGEKKEKKNKGQIMRKKGNSKSDCVNSGEGNEDGVGKDYRMRKN